MRHGAPVRDALLVPWLASLSLIAAAAMLQASFFPSGPRVEELPQATLQGALRQAGLDAVPLPSRPARSGSDIALSSRLGWSLPSGSRLWLVQGAVRRYEDLQAATLTRAQPDLRLQERRLDSPEAGSASGLIAGRPAVQTCLVAQSSGLPLPGVTRGALLKASDPRRSLADLRDPERWSATLVSLLRPRRFACVLVTLHSESARPLPPQLWPRLLPALQQALQPPTAS